MANPRGIRSKLALHLHYTCVGGDLPPAGPLRVAGGLVAGQAAGAVCVRLQRNNQAFRGRERRVFRVDQLEGSGLFAIASGTGHHPPTVAQETDDDAPRATPHRRRIHPVPAVRLQPEWTAPSRWWGASRRWSGTVVCKTIMEGCVSGERKRRNVELGVSLIRRDQVPTACLVHRDQRGCLVRRSKRSRDITLSQAATKSRTKSAWESSLA